MAIRVVIVLAAAAAALFLSLYCLLVSRASRVLPPSERGSIEPLTARADVASLAVSRSPVAVESGADEHEEVEDQAARAVPAAPDEVDLKTRQELTMLFVNELSIWFSPGADMDAIWPHLSPLAEDVLAQQVERQQYYDYMARHAPRTAEVYAVDDESGMSAQGAKSWDEYVWTQLDSKGAVRTVSRFHRGDYPELDAIVDRLTTRRLSVWSKLRGVEGVELGKHNASYLEMLRDRGVEIPESELDFVH